MTTFPWLIRLVSAASGVRYALGEPLVDRYLEFVAGRARPNSLRAVTFDLKTFFTVVAKDPVGVVAADVFSSLRTSVVIGQVVRLADRESGLSARTIARRLSSVSGFYAYLIARGDTSVRVNPVPREAVHGRTARDRPVAHGGVGAVPRTAEDLVARRGGPAGRRAAHGAGSGDGVGDGAGRAGPLRGAGAAVTRMCRSATDAWSWWKVTAGITGWCRPRTGSSMRSGITCTTNARAVHAPIGSSWCSRGRAADSRSRPRASMKSSRARGLGPGCRRRPVTGCGIPA